MTSRMEFRNYRSSAQLVHCNIHQKRYSDVPSLEGSGQGGGLQAHTQGDLQAYTWGGLQAHTQEVCIPACTEADPPQLMATAAGSTHPTGMHSCYYFIHCLKLNISTHTLQQYNNFISLLHQSRRNCLNFLQG